MLTDGEAGAAAVPGAGEADHLRRRLCRGSSHHRQRDSVALLLRHDRGARGEGAGAGASAPAWWGPGTGTGTRTRTRISKTAISGAPASPARRQAQFFFFEKIVRHSLGEKEAASTADIRVKKNFSPSLSLPKIRNEYFNPFNV